MEEPAPPDLSTEWLNFHHLRYFWVVAKEGSLRKAAEKLHVSQPSISAQIGLLESFLGREVFRRSGRSLVLTDFGRMVLGYAEEIFSSGRELLSAVKGMSSLRSLRLNVGILDSFPKLLSLDILRPVFAHDPPIRPACHEGKIEDLLGQLATHRLDVVLSDEPAPASSSVRTFNHPLGGCGVTFCAVPTLAKSLKGKFPGCLHKAPALLPTQNTPLRRELEKWFQKEGIEPLVVAEFEDAALAKIVATDGLGFTVIPTVVLNEATERYGFVSLGRSESCRTEFYVITVERHLQHPGVVSIVEKAKEAMTARSGKKARASAS